MTAEEVLNVSSKEIPDNNGEDHHKIITEHRNGDVKEISENGNVGGEVVSDSSTSDPIVTVDGNDAAVEDHKVEDESQRECEVVNDDSNSNIKENDSACETKTVDVVEKEGEICQNGSGSDVNDVHVSDTVADVGDEFASVQNGVSDKESNEIREGVKVDDDRELESVENGVVSENEICVAADVDKSDRECEGVENGAVDRDEEVKLESVDVQNGVVLESEICVDADVVRDEKDKEIEVPVVVEEEVTTAAAATDAVESVDSDVVEGSESKSKDHEIVESKTVDGVDVVSDEKNEIAVDVDGVCDDADVKECAVEDTQNGLENAVVESVSDTVVENGVAEVVENGVAEVEENVIPVDGSGQLEKSGEGSESQVLDDVDEGEHENKPSVKEESEVEPSDNAVKGEDESSIEVSEMKIDEVESEAEPSKEAVESVAEVSDNVVQIEADPSKEEAVESVAEVSNNVVQSEADASVDVPALKTEPAVIEAEPSVETEGEESKPSQETEGEDSKPSPEASATDAIDEQNIVTEVVRRPFYYLIRVPRYDDDENIKEQIQKALQQVEEKTKTRDEIRAESQTKKAICKEYGQEFRAAIQEERAARDLLKSKRQEMDSIQSIMNRLNNALSVGDIDGKIRNMEHMIQHETLPLKEEKQLIRQIKQLKQNRDELSTIIAKQDQSQSLDDKDSIEEHSKQLQLLKKELEVLRSNVLKTEAITKAAKKKYDEESNQLSEVLARFKAADDLRQEAYVKLQTLKRQLHEKSKYFWEYKNASTKGQELAIQGKKEELQSFCIDQAERIMEMWNKNEEFRKNYIRCNTRSTLRRLQTYDGRSLGPDEEPPVIPNAFVERTSKNDSLVERTSKNDSLVSRSIPEQQKKSTPTESVNTKDEPASKVAVQKPEIDQTTKAKKPAKPAPSEKKSKAPVRRWGDESDEDTKEEPKEPVRTKEEEERILKAEKARKEEEEAKQKEMKRLEEIEKAKEALQRKKRNAEKAQQRAAFKAQKEAEQKEKEREKRARKKGKRKGVSTEDIVDNTEQESAASPSSETLTRTTEVSDQSEKPVEVIKRPVKPSQFVKQNKVKSLPMAIRNRGKRRIQPWMWWALIAVLVVAALFYIGNNSSLRSSFQSYGF